ncbi:hypothetical protein HPE43_25265 [Escherichia coli]|nr:hypothetical protein HPE43_25265 [Escherichia coli]
MWIDSFQATVIFSIATYLDVILNPLMGFITDNFYQTKLGRRFGRRRFFILIAIPCMIIYPLLWVNGMSFGIIFLLISFLKWYIL